MEMGFLKYFTQPIIAKLKQAPDTNMLYIKTTCLLKHYFMCYRVYGKEVRRLDTLLKILCKHLVNIMRHFYHVDTG